MGPKFPWSPALEHHLVSVILLKGGHIAEKSKTTETWRDIYETLFNQELFAALKPHYYEPTDGGGIRAFRAKFVALQADVQRMMDTGNKSKYSGELSAIYSNMSTIKEERAKMDHIKSLSKEEKEAARKEMEEMEAQILTKSSHGIRRNLF